MLRSTILVSLLFLSAAAANAQEAEPPSYDPTVRPAELQEVLACFDAEVSLAQSFYAGLDTYDECWAAWEICAHSSNDFFSSGQCESFNQLYGCDLPCD